MAGSLFLNGGDEFRPGNEAQDRLLIERAGSGSALVVPTAAARMGPEQAVANAKRWFASLGLQVECLPVLNRSSARSAELAETARSAGMFYLVGGDPGRVVDVLVGSPVWEAMRDAGRAGAALAGSSAGAMALCLWTLIRSTWPDRSQRRYKEALGLLPDTVVLPHFETFGHRWIASARDQAPVPSVVLLGMDERTAAIWHDGTWTCAGAGRVTIDDGWGQVSYRPGDVISGLPAPDP